MYNSKGKVSVYDQFMMDSSSMFGQISFLGKYSNKFNVSITHFSLLWCVQDAGEQFQYAQLDYLSG